MFPFLPGPALGYITIHKVVEGLSRELGDLQPSFMTEEIGKHVAKTVTDKRCRLGMVLAGDEAFVLTYKEQVAGGRPMPAKQGRWQVAWKEARASPSM